MPVTATLVLGSNKREEGEDAIRYERSYTIPFGASLADASLERGDDVLDVQYAEIVLVEVGVAQTQKGTKGLQLVSIVGLLNHLYAGVGRTDELRELAKSRVLTKGSGSIQYVRRFEIARAAISESTRGWLSTSNGPFFGTGANPDYGVAYPFGTWTIAPKIIQVRVVPEWSPSKALVEAIYRGPRSAEDVLSS